MGRKSRTKGGAHFKCDFNGRFGVWMVTLTRQPEGSLPMSGPAGGELEGAGSLSRLKVPTPVHADRGHVCFCMNVLEQAGHQALGPLLSSLHFQG